MGALTGGHGNDLDEIDLFDLSIAGEGGWEENLDYGESVSESLASAGARHLLVSSADKVKHSAVHAAAVKHAAHKKSERARSGSPMPAAHAAAKSSIGMQKLAPSGVSLPKIPKRPPVCSVPPAMRFCKNINYPVYRPDEDHTFAEVINILCQAVSVCIRIVWLFVQCSSCYSRCIVAWVCVLVFLHVLACQIKS